MLSRYDDRIIAVNKHERYEELFKDRGLRYIKQYKTARLAYPTDEQIAKLNILGHVWVTGDRYYKLADKYYGDSRLWWVLSWFNHKPTESHISLGEVLYIPLPLEKILELLDV